MFGFRLPTHVLIATGARGRLRDVLAARKARHVLLVVDPGLAITAWPAEAMCAIAAAGARVTTFEQVEANPRTETVERTAALARDEGIDLVVGLGGGSVLDAAKATAMLATNDGRAADFAGQDRFRNPPLPFVAIPTTCGTGSEVTWVSVLSDPGARTKISVKGFGMFPDQALVDADLLTTLPRSLVAWTGLDALTHALEATTCKAANPVSDALAETAIRLLFDYLPRAAADIVGDHRARAMAMRAATTAGIAFGNADVASVHCLSEALGGTHDVPHGLTNAILLLPMLRYNRPAIDARLAELLSVVAPDAAERDGEPARRADAFLARLEALLQGLEVPPFSTLAVAASDFGEIASRAAANGSNPSNACPMAVEDYLAVLHTVGGDGTVS